VFRRFAIPLVCLLQFASICSADQYRVIHVVDAETIKAVGHGMEVKIRLVGIEKPASTRKRTRYGKEYLQRQSRLYLADMVLNKDVEVHVYGLDIYNHLLAVVFVDGKNVNLEMIRAGMAKVDRSLAPRAMDLTLFWKAEQEARAAKRGIWAASTKRLVFKSFDQRTLRKGKTAKTTTVRRIDVEIAEGIETVSIHLKGFSIPSVFDLNGDNPRLVIDFFNVSAWKGRRLIPVGGRLIQRIRAYLHKESFKLRIVLDLTIDPSKDYSVSQIYDIKKQVYQIQISSVR